MTFEFKSAVGADGQLVVPADIAGQIPLGQQLHVVLTWETPVEGDAQRLGETLREKSFSAAVGETAYDSLA
jgi:hypothetical protein